MANTISSTMMTHEAPSITQLGAREFGDEIRYLGIGNAVLTSIIENSLFQDGKRKTGKGLISKRSVKNVKYEMYTRTSRPYKLTVTAGTEVASTGVTLSDVNGVPLYFTIHNPRNATSFRVEAVNTSTKVVKGTTFGATTFSCVAGDTLVLMAPAFPEGSTETVVINGSDDHNFNTLQFSRWAVSISWVLEAIKQIAGGNRLQREKMYLLWEALADWERTMILSEYTSGYATKNTTTGAQTGYTGEFPTTKGLMKLAANSVSAEGAATLSWIRQKLPIAMGEQVNDNDSYIMLCGNQYYGRLIEEMNEKIALDRDGEMKQYGIKATEIVTAGPNIKLVKHNLFNVTGLDTQALVFNPANLGYVYLEGHDMGPNNNIQTAATHGKIDEIYQYAGIETLDAGKSLTVVSNLYA
jgi:hypothetical protein